MFNNPGSKIKKVAYIFFAIYVVISAILALSFSTGLTSQEQHLIANLISVDTTAVFIIIWLGYAISVFLAYVLSLMIYGYGEIVEKSAGNKSSSTSSYSKKKKGELPWWEQ